MTDFEIWGPWTGNAISVAPPSYLDRRRAKFWRILLIAAVLVMVGCGLAGLAGT